MSSLSDECATKARKRGYIWANLMFFSFITKKKNLLEQNVYIFSLGIY